MLRLCIVGLLVISAGLSVGQSRAYAAGTSYAACALGSADDSTRYSAVAPRLLGSSSSNNCDSSTSGNAAVSTIVTAIAVQERAFYLVHDVNGSCSVCGGTGPNNMGGRAVLITNTNLTGVSLNGVAITSPHDFDISLPATYVLTFFETVAGVTYKFEGTVGPFNDTSLPLAVTNQSTTITAPLVSIANQTISEGNAGTAVATMTVSLSAASTTAVTVDYATSNNTATAGSDYTAATGTLTFAPGDVSKVISVTVAGDTLVEADETVNVTLSNATAAAIDASAGTATLTITNDDTNTAPVANAGPDQTVNHNDLVTLTGAGSSDPDGDALTYNWTAPAGISLSANSVISPTFTAPLLAVNTTYSFSLTVTDPSGLNHTDIVLVTVQEGQSALVSRTQSVIGEQLAANATLLTTQDPNLTNRLQTRQRQRNAQRSRTSFADRDSVELPLNVDVRVDMNRLDSGTVSDAPMLVDLDTSLHRMMNFGAPHAGLGSDNRATDVWVKLRWSKDKSGTRDSENSLAYIGVDHQVTPTTLVGFLVQADAYQVDNKTTAYTGSGTGWMAGPYVSSELSDGLYVDARLAWGQADNKVSPFGTYRDQFESNRMLASASVKETLTGAGLLEGFELEPELEGIYYQETQEAYTDSNGVTIPETELKMSRVSFGPTLRYGMEQGGGYSNRTVSFHAGARGVWTHVSSNVVVLSPGLSPGFTSLNTDGVTARLQAGLKWDWAHADGKTKTLEVDTFVDGFMDDDKHTQGLSLKYRMAY